MPGYRTCTRHPDKSPGQTLWEKGPKDSGSSFVTGRAGLWSFEGWPLLGSDAVRSRGIGVGKKGDDTPWPRCERCSALRREGESCLARPPSLGMAVLGPTTYFCALKQIRSEAERDTGMDQQTYSTGALGVGHRCHGWAKSCGAVWCGAVCRRCYYQMATAGMSCTRKNAKLEGCVHKRALCVVCCAPVAMRFPPPLWCGVVWCGVVWCGV